MLYRYFKKLKNLILCKKWTSLILCLFYITGIILGIIFAKGQQNYNDFYIFVINYHNKILGLYSSPFKLFFTRLLNNVFYFLLTYILCCSSYLIWINLIVFLYRGIVLGSVFFVFFELFSIHGILIFLTLVVIQNLIVTLTLLCTILYINCIKNKCKKHYFTIYYIRILFFGYLISLVGALYELILLLTFFRPLNIYF